MHGSAAVRAIKRDAGRPPSSSGAPLPPVQQLCVAYLAAAGTVSSCCAVLLSALGQGHSDKLGAIHGGVAEVV